LPIVALGLVDSPLALAGSAKIAPHVSQARTALQQLPIDLFGLRQAARLVMLESDLQFVRSVGHDEFNPGGQELTFCAERRNYTRTICGPETSSTEPARSRASECATFPSLIVNDRFRDRFSRLPKALFAFDFDANTSGAQHAVHLREPEFFLPTQP
jgi:hypothetical protein